MLEPREAVPPVWPPLHRRENPVYKVTEVSFVIVHNLHRDANLCEPVKSKRAPANIGPASEERPAVSRIRPRGVVRLVLEAMVRESTTITLEM